MHVSQVQTPRDLQAFVQLAYHRYAHDTHWVPPLRGEQRKLLSRKGNPMLKHCDYALYLLWDGSRAIGRIAAFVDHVAVDFWGQPIGFWGSYECPDDDLASKLLFDAAKGFLQAHGMATMRGPINFTVTEWGFLAKGYDRAHVFMSPYNPPFYNDQALSYGMYRAKDLLAFEGDVAQGYVLPQRFSRSMERIAQRYHVTVRPLDMANLERDVGIVVDILNHSVVHNWGSYPVTQEEGLALVNDLKQIVVPEFVLFAQVEGQPIGFVITLPDINRLLKGLNGRLFPLGFLRLLVGLKRLRYYRTWALGLLPEYHGKGIDSLLYYRTYQVARQRGAHIEVNYVLEDNIKMLAPLDKMGLEHTKTFRVYEMALGSAAG